MIERRIRTRGYEVDGTRSVSLPVLLSYCESLRWEWIQDESLGLVPLLHRGHFFVVHEQTAEILRTVGMSTELLLRARFERVGRSQAVVQQALIRQGDGALVARARVTGCWLGPHRRLARIPDLTREAARQDADVMLYDAAALRIPAQSGHGELSFIAPADRDYAPLGLEVSLPESAPSDAAVDHTRVRPSDLDVFEHVNASNWLRFAFDARLRAARRGDLPETALLPARRVSISHPREAVAEDELTLYSWMVGPNSVACHIETRGELACRVQVDTASAHLTE